MVSFWNRLSENYWKVIYYSLNYYILPHTAIIKSVLAKVFHPYIYLHPSHIITIFRFSHPYFYFNPHFKYYRKYSHPPI